MVTHFRSVLLKVWCIEQQHLYHLKTYSKYKILGSTSEQLSQITWEWSPEICVLTSRSLEVILMLTQC
jgi:hypothetical protein